MPGLFLRSLLGTLTSFLTITSLLVVLYKGRSCSDISMLGLYKRFIAILFIFRTREPAFTDLRRETARSLVV